MRYAVIHNYYASFNESNRVFDSRAYKIGANLHRWADSLRQVLLDHRIELNTLDCHPESALISAVVFMDYPDESDVIGQRLLRLTVPKFLFTCESPIIRPQNFSPENKSKFTKIFTYDLDKVDGDSIEFAQPYGFRVEDVPVEGPSEFSKRRLLCAMAGNKANAAASSLYELRRNDYLYFSSLGCSQFSLYGKGWSSEEPCYRGVVENKLATLSKYRFSLCYENTAARSWYLSEKLLEVMQANCVPVYAGPTEIEKILPRSAVILRSDFDSAEALHRYLAEMSETRFETFLASARAWLTSGYGALWQIERNTKAVAETIFTSIYGAKPVKVGRGPQGTKARAGRVRPPSICVTVGVGNELPVFESTFCFWKRYVDSLPDNLKVFFVKADNQLESGKVSLEGNVASVGVDLEALQRGGSDGYSKTGIWSSIENVACNTRNAFFFEWLLKTGNVGDITLGTTLTSFVDLAGLAEFAKSLPRSALYGGTVKCGQLQPGGRFYSFVSGANTYMSADVMELYLERVIEQTDLLAIPNDLLAGYLLRDIPRLGVPFFSFDATSREQSRYVESALDWARKIGFFHYRFKSSVGDPVRRDEIDSGSWLLAHHRSDDAVDGRLAVGLSLRYSDALNAKLRVPTVEGYTEKLNYYERPTVPMFLSQLLPR